MRSCLGNLDELSDHGENKESMGHKLNDHQETKGQFQNPKIFNKINTL